MRVVLDTNVVVSALIWGGVPRQLLDLGRDSRTTLFTSSLLLNELADVLERDKFASLLAAQDITPTFLMQRYGKPPSQTARRLGRTVRLLRVARSWSQEQLAEIAGLERSFIGAVERAERYITVATAEKLAKAFDLTVADLLVAQSTETFVRALQTDQDN